MPSLQDMLMMAIAFLTALTVHEYAHARSALAAGDDTAERAGRVSLNPLDHLDPVGTVMFVLTMINGFGIAWGKPVPVNPLRFKHPRWDNLKVSFWGPLSNLIFACMLALGYRFLVVPYAPTYEALLKTCVKMNLVLAFFNLIPIPPLDGSHILSSLLPTESARRYDYTMGRYGMIILLVLLISGITWAIIWPPVSILFHLLTGVRW